MGELIAFPESLLTLDEFVKKAHGLALKSENVYMDCPHVKARMKERGVTMMQILDVLRRGKGFDGPTLDQYGDWRIKLKCYVTTAGRSIQVVVVVRDLNLEVITVI